MTTEIPYVNDKKHKEQNIEKLKKTGKRGVKKQIITTFISSGSSKDMNKYQIARAAKVDPDDKELMKHIEIMLKRHEERKKK
jgi:hypothetical protein